MNDASSQLYERLLVLRCQAGDEAALEELIARYSTGLRFFLAKLIGNSDAADDLLQETWIDVYRKISRLQDAGAWVSWLYRIARDKAYRHLRRKPRESEGDDDACVQLLAVEEERFTEEDTQDLRAALDRLPTEQREILVLRFVYGMSYQQVAEVVARPVGTVRSRIHYAKLALRQKLESKPIGKVLPP